MSGRYVALITAGGRLAPDMERVCGTRLKALAPLRDALFIEHVIVALRDSGAVSAIAVVGPVGELSAAGVVADVWADEGATGPENIRRGIVALREAGYLGGEERLLLCATDAVFLHADTVCELIRVAETRPDADVVFPVVREGDYESRFAGSPNVYASLADGSLTGSSVQIVRPAAMERCLPQIERAFAARKSQWEMAKLLGIGVICQFLMRTLTIAAAEARIAAVTGLIVYAPVFADPRVAADVDTLGDYEFALKLVRDEAAGGALLRS